MCLKLIHASLHMHWHRLALNVFSEFPLSDQTGIEPVNLQKTALNYLAFTEIVYLTNHATETSTKKCKSQ